MAAVGDLGRELDRPLERVEIVAERIRPARRPEADGRRDPPEQVVGGDQNTILEQRQLTVGMTRGGDDVPAVETVTVVDELGVQDRPDERLVEQSLADQLLGDGLRHPVRAEPADQHLRPLLVLPDEAGLAVSKRP